MIATTAILNKPTFKFYLSRPHKANPTKPTLFLRFPALKTGFPSGFVSEKGWWSESMTELVRASAFRSSSGGGDGDRDREESVGLFQQEALVDGSNELATRFVPQGFESTLNRLSKWLVAGLFGVVILWRHDAEALWAVMGSIINSILSAILKKTLNQERPVAMLRPDPGMPSSHAQSIFFTISFVIWSLIEWQGVNEVSLILGAVALAFGSYLSWLRVSQQLHTISQVVVGAAIGCTFSVLWLWSWDAVVLEAFVSSLAVRIAIIVSAAIFCLGFLLYVIRYWFRDDH